MVSKAMGWSVHCIKMRSWCGGMKSGGKTGLRLGWASHSHPTSLGPESWKPLTPLTLSHSSSSSFLKKNQSLLFDVCSLLFLCACWRGEHSGVCSPDRAGQPPSFLPSSAPMPFCSWFLYFICP